MSGYDLSIVLVSWNTRDLLLACLDALGPALGKLNAETFMVDNASTDDSVGAVRARHPQVRIIANPSNRGFAAANNQAIRLSTGRHILLLNSDTLPLPGALVTLVTFLDRHPEVGIVGAQLLNSDGSLQRSWAAFPSLPSELLGRNFRARARYSPWEEPEAYAVDWVGGACLLIRQSTLARIGLLDERFFMYSEEADWCYRARQGGWLVCYLPAARVIHYGGRSSSLASLRMKAELYRSKLLFFYKHYGAARARALGLLLQAGFAARLLLQRARAEPTGGEAALLIRAIGQTMTLAPRGSCADEVR